MRSRLTPAECSTVAAIAAVVIALHALGFVLLFAVVVPRHFTVGDSGVFGAGLGLTAYTLGLRHAFDADHIAAIDNTTRKLMAEGKRPLSVGLFFSLGHSTIVFALAVAFSLGLRHVGGAWPHMIGPTVSGAFLWVIGVLNLLVLVSIVRLIQRPGGREEPVPEPHGLMSGLYRRAAVSAPWRMYPVGLLFGLGFDTATEVALLASAGAAAAGGLPFYAILCLPILFAAGMSLLDSIDGAFMTFAYGWAFSKPARKVFYNLTVTWLSVVVALVIGTVELMSVFVGGLDLHYVGFAIVALFAVTWAGAVAVWRLARIEERWSP